MSPNSGVVDVFWRGTDNDLWHKGFTPSTGWNAPEPLHAGPLGSDPYPVSPSAGVVDVFWTGTDNNLWHKMHDGGWKGHESLGAGPLGSRPYPVSPSPGVIDVFWKGTDNNLWHKWFVPNAGGWQGHESLSAGPLGLRPLSDQSKRWSRRCVLDWLQHRPLPQVIRPERRWLEWSRESGVALTRRGAFSKN